MDTPIPLVFLCRIRYGGCWLGLLDASRITNWGPRGSELGKVWIPTGFTLHQAGRRASLSRVLMAYKTLIFLTPNLDYRGIFYSAAPQEPLPFGSMGFNFLRFGSLLSPPYLSQKRPDSSCYGSFCFELKAIKTCQGIIPTTMCIFKEQIL